MGIKTDAGSLLLQLASDSHGECDLTVIRKWGQKWFVDSYYGNIYQHMSLHTTLDNRETVCTNKDYTTVNQGTLVKLRRVTEGH